MRENYKKVSATSLEREREFEPLLLSLFMRGRATTVGGSGMIIWPSLSSHAA